MNIVIQGVKIIEINPECKDAALENCYKLIIEDHRRDLVEKYRGLIKCKRNY